MDHVGAVARIWRDETGHRRLPVDDAGVDSGNHEFRASTRARVHILPFSHPPVRVVPACTVLIDHPGDRPT
jgi:hypothetical protein